VTWRDDVRRKWKREVEELTNDLLLARWKEDYETLAADVRTIHRRRIIFSELDDEMVRRAAMESGYVVERFLRPMYVEAQVVALRRLNDGDVRSVSFRRLLDEMRLRPNVATRSHYVEMAVSQFLDDPDGHHRRVEEENFDRLAGAGHDHLRDDVLAGYLKQLDEDLARVKQFVDKNVAHRDRLEAQALTWRELDAVIDNLEFRMNDVGLVLTGATYAAAPSPPPMWREAFQRLFERSS